MSFGCLVTGMFTNFAALVKLKGIFRMLFWHSTWHVVDVAFLNVKKQGDGVSTAEAVAGFGRIKTMGEFSVQEVRSDPTSNFKKS